MNRIDHRHDSRSGRLRRLASLEVVRADQDDGNLGSTGQLTILDPPEQVLGLVAGKPEVRRLETAKVGDPGLTSDTFSVLITHGEGDGVAPGTQPRLWCQQPA